MPDGMFVARVPKIEIADGMAHISGCDSEYYMRASVFRAFAEDCRVALLAYDSAAKNLIRLGRKDG